MKVLGFLAAAAVAVAAAPAAAQTAWEQIGGGEVPGGDGTGTLSARGGDRLGELMLCVEHSRIRIRALTIRYGSGDTHNVRLRERLDDGDCSRGVSLRGRNRDIVSVDIDYEADGRAEVQLFAR